MGQAAIQKCFMDQVVVQKSFMGQAAVQECFLGQGQVAVRKYFLGQVAVQKCFLLIQGTPCLLQVPHKSPSKLLTRKRHCNLISLAKGFLSSIHLDLVLV